MAKTEERVQSLGNFWDLTNPSAQIAKQMVAQEQARRGERPTALLDFNQRIEVNNMEVREEARENSLNEKMEEIKPLLKKAGLSLDDFPFEFRRDKDGMIVDFTPKGKSKEEALQNIVDFKEKITLAFEQGKIDQDEFDKINDNLEEMMEEKGVEFEEDKIEITEKEIQENLAGLLAEVYGNVEQFEKDCEKYDQMDLEDRKFKLDSLNSKINQRLGIAGNLEFSKNPNLKYEQTFNKNGYCLTEEEVRKNGLKQTVHNMMEKSMVRQKEIKSGIELSNYKKKVMHDKLVAEAKKRKEREVQAQEREQERQAQQKAMQYKRNMF